MKNKVKISVPPFSKHRIIEKDNKYIVEIPYLYFFWTPLKIKIVNIVDLSIIAEFDNKSELNDFIKYIALNYKRIKNGN
jgi:hypothetical protein